MVPQALAELRLPSGYPNFAPPGVLALVGPERLSPAEQRRCACGGGWWRGVPGTCGGRRFGATNLVQLVEFLVG
jgi:hypothetical protein